MKIRTSTLVKGHCVSFVDEVGGIRNPFKSIHAAALILLAETASGLCVYTVIGKGDRAIPGQITCNYFKKSRGRIVAECKFDRPEKSGDCKAVVKMTDSKGDLTAECLIQWHVELGVKQK